MKFEVTSKALGKVIFNRLDQTIETAEANARSSAMLCGIDPDDLEVAIAENQMATRCLSSYGEEWLVSSDEVAAVAPRPDHGPTGRFF